MFSRKLPHSKTNTQFPVAENKRSPLEKNTRFILDSIYFRVMDHTNMKKCLEPYEVHNFIQKINETTTDRADLEAFRIKIRNMLLIISDSLMKFEHAVSSGQIALSSANIRDNCDFLRRVIDNKSTDMISKGISSGELSSLSGLELTNENFATVPSIEKDNFDCSNFDNNNKEKGFEFKNIYSIHYPSGDYTTKINKHKGVGGGKKQIIKRLNKSKMLKKPNQGYFKKTNVFRNKRKHQVLKEYFEEETRTENETKGINGSALTKLEISLNVEKMQSVSSTDSNETFLSRLESLRINSTSTSDSTETQMSGSQKLNNSIIFTGFNKQRKLENDSTANSKLHVSEIFGNNETINNSTNGEKCVSFHSNNKPENKIQQFEQTNSARRGASTNVVMCISDTEEKMSDDDSQITNCSHDIIDEIPETKYNTNSGCNNEISEMGKTQVNLVSLCGDKSANLQPEPKELEIRASVTLDSFSHSQNIYVPVKTRLYGNFTATRSNNEIPETQYSLNTGCSNRILEIDETQCSQINSFQETCDDALPSDLKVTEARAQVSSESSPKLQLNADAVEFSMGNIDQYGHITRCGCEKITGMASNIENQVCNEVCNTDAMKRNVSTTQDLFPFPSESRDTAMSDILNISVPNNTVYTQGVDKCLSLSSNRVVIDGEIVSQPLNLHDEEDFNMTFPLINETNLSIESQHNTSRDRKLELAKAKEECIHVWNTLTNIFNESKVDAEEHNYSFSVEPKEGVLKFPVGYEHHYALLENILTEYKMKFGDRVKLSSYQKEEEVLDLDEQMKNWSEFGEIISDITNKSKQKKRPRQ